MLKKLLILAIALFIPLIIMGGSIWFVAHPWFISVEYKKIVFPPDMTTKDRRDLALIGLHSIMPGTQGISLLQQAHLPDGKPAFNEREIKHMADVRHILWLLFLSALLSALFFLLLTTALFNTSFFTVLIQGYKVGAFITIFILMDALIAVFFNFDAFFLKMHRFFFEGDSFLFNEEDTLMRLYPEQLWEDAALFTAIVSLIIALLFLFATHTILKKQNQ